MVVERHQDAKATGKLMPQILYPGESAPHIHTVRGWLGPYSWSGHFGKAIPLQASTSHYGSGRLRLSEYLYNWHMKVISLSSLCNAHPDPTRRYPCCSFLLKASRP